MRYARDLSLPNHRGGFLAKSYAASPNYNNCLGSADPLDCLQNGPNPINQNPILSGFNNTGKTVADIPRRITTGAYQEQQDFNKGFVKPIQDQLNAFIKGTQAQFAPCPALGKYGMMFPIPCWLLAVFAILGVFILIKVR